MKNPSENSKNSRFEVISYYDIHPLIEIMKDERVHPEDLLSDFLETGTLVASGTEADVYISNDERFDELCVKLEARSTERSIFNEGILSETDRQYEALKILQKTESDNSDIQLARIPIPIFGFNDAESRQKCILMEYISGKTLWRIFLEKIIERADESQLGGWEKDHLLAMNDDDLSDIIITIFRLSELKTERDMFKSLLNRLGDERFIPQEMFERLQNTICILNDAGFYHRDLHPKNVMLDEKDVWLIDFGYSLNSFMMDSRPNDPYNVDKMGQSLSFSRDEGILSLVKNYVIQSEQDIKQERVRLLADERKKMDRVLKLLSRQKSTVSSVIESTEYDNNVDFINAITEDQKLKTGVTNAILGNDIDKLLMYVKMLSILETDRFDTAKATYDYIEGVINQYNPSSTLLNRVWSELNFLNFNIK